MKISPDTTHPAFTLSIMVVAVLFEATPANAFNESALTMDSMTQTIGCDVGVSNGSSKPVVVCTNPRYHVDNNWD